MYFTLKIFIVFLFTCCEDDPISNLYDDTSENNSSENYSNYYYCGGSGACSWHDGVDCTRGEDSDGSVICDDGWRDSSVSFDAVCYDQSIIKSISLIDSRVEPGSYKTVWDGRNGKGLELASGFYFVKLKATGETETYNSKQKIILMK